MHITAELGVKELRLTLRVHRTMCKHCRSLLKAEGLVRLPEFHLC